MDWQGKIGEGIKRTSDYAGKFLLNGGHAQQDIPAQHRLLSAGGMFLGWMAVDQLRDVIFGVNQISEGDFQEIKREEVPAPLRFLHKTIDWNPHSDAPHEQWKKLAHQLLPAIGAGIGTVAGSMYAFERNGRAQQFANIKNSKTPLLFMDAEMAAQYSHSRALRILTAATGGFSAASMMPLIYGAFLNLSFASANGARIFAGDLAMGSAGPAKALETQLGTLPAYAKAAFNSKGEISEAWAEGFVKKVLTPLFGKDLKDPKSQLEVRHKIQDILKTSFDRHKTEGLNEAKFAEAVTADMKRIFGNNKDGNGFDKAIHTLGLHKDNATMGNAIPPVRRFNKYLANLGMSTPTKSFADRVQTPTSGIGPAMGSA